MAGVDLDVAPGQIVSVLGRNGAGKSTLISIIAGLLVPDSGTVVLDGRDAVADPAGVAGSIGIAPQETGIYPVLSVAENLTFFGELAGLDGSRRRQRVTEVAAQLGLTPLLDRPASKLSGGEARRLHTGCALVHSPRLLMLDEPTVGADVATRTQLIDAVRSLATEGAGIIYTTHYLPEVVDLDAEIVIVDEGRVLAKGSRSELIAAHHLSGLRISYDGALPEAATAGLDVTHEKNGAIRLGGDVDLGSLINRLGDDVTGLRSVETLEPNLESVFLAVTGSTLASEES